MGMNKHFKFLQNDRKLKCINYSYYQWDKNQKFIMICLNK
jgi:hypothetical protein